MPTRPEANGDVFVNVVDMIDLCTSAKLRAARTHDERLMNAAVSLMSALVLHLGSRHAAIPAALRDHYNYLMENH